MILKVNFITFKHRKIALSNPQLFIAYSVSKNIKGTIMNKRKRILIPLVLMIIIGGFLISNSELENTRLLDIAQLVVLGMLLGVLLTNLKATYWNKK
jgi:hypothetical protein